MSSSSCVFHGIPFLLVRMTIRQTMVIQIWIFGRYFLGNEVSLSFKGKQYFCLSQNLSFSSENYNFGKLVFTTMCFESFKECSDKIIGDTNDVISFSTLYDVTYQHLEGLHMSVNQYFPKYLKISDTIK